MANVRVKDGKTFVIRYGGDQPINNALVAERYPSGDPEHYIRLLVEDEKDGMIAGLSLTYMDAISLMEWLSEVTA